jgi:hypothetical protein
MSERIRDDLFVELLVPGVATITSSVFLYGGVKVTDTWKSIDR